MKLQRLAHAAILAAAASNRATFFVTPSAPPAGMSRRAIILGDTMPALDMFQPYHPDIAERLRDGDMA